jgi:hypothetical protein
MIHVARRDMRDTSGIFFQLKTTYPASIAFLSSTAVTARPRLQTMVKCNLDTRRAGYCRCRIATSTSVLKFHVARQELERKFEIILQTVAHLLTVEAALLSKVLA